MKLELENKSEKIRNRIEIIQAELERHKNNIELLHFYVTERKNITGLNFAPRVIKYSYIPYCEKRYHFTVNNLQQQISLLERELAVLNEYFM